LKQAEAAVQAFQRALALQPDFTQARVALGRLLIELKRWDDAVPILDTLIDKGDDSAEIRFTRGCARLELGQISEALEDLQYAYAREPSNDSLRALALTLWMRGEKDAFDSLLGQALENPMLVVAAADAATKVGAALSRLACAVSVVPVAWHLADKRRFGKSYSPVRRCARLSGSDLAIARTLLLMILIQKVPPRRDY
jgi:tetratricopeptide (TPR) repeat protein